MNAAAGLTMVVMGSGGSVFVAVFAMWHPDCCDTQSGTMLTTNVRESVAGRHSMQIHIHNGFGVFIVCFVCVPLSVVDFKPNHVIRSIVIEFFLCID